MWRSRYEEDWERRKQYLIRSLFEEVPPLSPVPEEDESFDSRRTTTPPRAYIPRSTSRPHSPLPPLIIEREPNRHDEPEEFYRKLEKKILKVYRKLFIEGKSDVSSDTSDEEVIEAGVDSMEMEVWKGMEKQSFGIDNDDLQDADINVEMAEISNDDVNVEEQDSFRENESHLNTESFESDEQNSFGEANDNLHNEVFIENNEKNNSGEAGRLIDNDNKSNESTDADDELQSSDETVEVEKRRKRSISQDNNDASESKKSKSFDDRSSTEVLPESVEEENSTNDDLLADIEPNDFRDHRIVQVEADIHRNAGEETPRAMPSVVENAFEDVDDNVMTAMLEENRVPDSLSSSGCKRSWSSVSEESISYEDAGTQTQCGHGRVNRDILKDIFVGPSKVLRICSCVNHICVC